MGGLARVGAPMRKRYARFVDLSNQGAREMGFKDTGVMWRAGYDMPPEQFSAEMDRLWEQVRPLYLSLHTYVRGRLVRNTGRMSFRRTARFRRTCWEIRGRRSGENLTHYGAAGKQPQL